MTLSVEVPILQTCFGDEPELSYFREKALGVARENVYQYVWIGLVCVYARTGRRRPGRQDVKVKIKVKPKAIILVQCRIF